MSDFLFVSCTAGAKEETDLYRSLTKLGVSDYRFFEQNQRGLPECYNEVLAEQAGRETFVAFVHDDVTIADVFWEEKLTAAFERFAIVGVAGAAGFNLHAQPDRLRWLDTPRQNWSGAVEHPVRNHPGLTMWAAYGPTPKRCIVMDGLFLAADMRKIGDVRFDERFQFDCYDMDFCLTAHQAGLTMGTTNLYVQHASGGNFSSERYRAAVQTFRGKWSAQVLWSV